MENKEKASAPVVEKDNKKEGKGLKAAVVITSILAVLGIGFGVFGMIQNSTKDTEVSNLKKDVEDLKKKETTPKVENNTSTVATDELESVNNSNAGRQNPVIKAEEPSRYTINGNAYTLPDSNNQQNYVSFTISDGAVFSCDLYTRDYHNQNEAKHVKQCSISIDSEKKISKITDLFRGNGIGYGKTALIMEDGSILYKSQEELVREVVETGTATIKDVAKIDGFVVDAIPVQVRDGFTGFASVVFIMSDGSLVEFNESMVE